MRNAWIVTQRLFCQHVFKALCRKELLPKRWRGNYPASMLWGWPVAKVGAPTKYPESEKERKKLHALILEMGEQGKSKMQMAAAAGVDRHTLNIWADKYPELSTTIKQAVNASQAWWEDIGQNMASGSGLGSAGNATSYIFQMKNRFKEDYRDKQEIEHSGSVGIADRINRARKRTAKP